MSKAQALTLPSSVISLAEIKPEPIATFDLVSIDTAISKISGIDQNDIPQTVDELGDLLSYAFDMTVTRAGELNIPVIGSVGGGYNRRVVVWEWTRYKALFDENEIEYRYGYVVRFCLTVSKWDAEAKLSLPFLSAQAEVGNIQASWVMQVRGLVGSEIDSVVLPPQELDVETFVIAQQSLRDVIAAINHATTKFVPGTLLSKLDPNSPTSELWLAAVRAYACDSVRRGRTLAQSTAKLGSSDLAANDTILDVYDFFGLSDPQTKPSNEVRQRARDVMGGISANA